MPSPVSPLWHPFTQHALRSQLPKAIFAEGAYITTEDGARYLDAISSWWVITHRHRHPRIVEAVREQSSRLDQVIFAEFTHEPAEQLAERLITVAPEGLTRVFLSDSGSTSVEVALKMALGYWRRQGESRSQVVVMEHSYHGDTVGAMSVGARGPFTQAYEAVLFEVDRIPFPGHGQENATLKTLETICEKKKPAAFLVEPLVLGAGGMLMYSSEVLRGMREICARHKVLFIADEVMTGFGRTGSLFACEQAQVQPDILCCSKGLTGGFLPLAATLCRDEVYQAFYSNDRAHTFYHSSSFTGNPMACAAALANLKIWETDSVRERVSILADAQRRQLKRFEGDSRVEQVRQTGTITAMNVRTTSRGYLSNIAPALHESFLASRIVLRPLGNVIYVMPPYCVDEEDLDRIYSAIAASLDAVTAL